VVGGELSLRGCCGVMIDLNGKRISLSEEEVRWLISRGTAQAGISSQRRDLALILQRGLASEADAKLLVLTRFESRTLDALLRERTPDAA
jgi:hypothetical protein